MLPYKIIIIGGGFTGAATAHDLALRGFHVTLLEQGEIVSGTSGRCHCLLHSGGRYCVNDQESAIECIEENTILRKILPHGLETNGGLFVALDDSDLEYKGKFLEGCAAAGIPAKEISGEQARRLEPNLSPRTLGAVEVPDGTFESLRLGLSFLATAKKNNAHVYTYTKVKELVFSGKGSVIGVVAENRLNGTLYQFPADIVINAAGPWSGNIAQIAGVKLTMIPTPGVMVSLDKRLHNRVINRLNISSDGDIIVPQRGMSIIGTTSWAVDNADYIPILEDHIQKMLDRGGELIPCVKKVGIRGVFAVARPLIGSKSDKGREIARTFKCFDHSESDGVEGFVTITGGKATTSRAMAEAVSNVVCHKLGVNAECRTREVVLTSYREYYT
jgi:glycerol-3-phosphate dehydrogenase